MVDDKNCFITLIWEDSCYEKGESFLVKQMPLFGWKYRKEQCTCVQRIYVIKSRNKDENEENTQWCEKKTYFFRGKFIHL